MLGRETRAISSGWYRVINSFCARKLRPLHLYTAEVLLGRLTPEARDLLWQTTMFRIRRLPVTRLRSLAAICKIPYWREMRADELRAVLQIVWLEADLSE